MPLQKILAGLLLALFLSACKTTPQEVTQTVPMAAKPKNVILMIGDGMGLSQVSAALYTNNNHLNLEQFPVIGFHKSHSYTSLITDSAAGATAFACGVKTYNNAIGMDKDSMPCRSILEDAEASGLATGLVATSTIVHATPASFIAHQDIRMMYEEIAADFLRTEIDLFIGGGKRFFDRREKDERNLYKELKEKGYQMSDYSRTSLTQVKLDFDKNFGYFTADSDPLPVMAGRNYLTNASEIATDFLEKHGNGKGFFLMIEGSQIDWAGHANEGKWMIQEILDFDKAIGKVLEFAKKRGDTLVIVTADHETGGLALNPKSRFGRVKTAFTNNNHTASLVPVYAYGPMAGLFAGIYDNTKIHDKIYRAFGFESSTAAH